MCRHRWQQGLLGWSVAMSLLVTVLSVQQIMQRRGSVLGIPCRGAANPEAFTLIWLKDDVQIARSLTDVNGTRKLSITKNIPRIDVGSQDFMLRINASVLEDSGVYVCQGLDVPDVNGTEILLFEESTRVVINDVPEPPENPPLVTAVDQHSLDVKWNHSLEDNNSPVTEYLVLIRSEDEPSWENVISIPTPADTNLTQVTGLHPHMGYQVVVKAKNFVGLSPPSVPSEMVKTMSDVPSADALPRIIKKVSSTHSIYVEFEPPPKHTINGRFDGYLLKHKRDDAEDTVVKLEFKPNLTSYNFTDLRPHNMYHISINIFTDKGEGPPVEQIAFTKQGVPSKPRILDIENRTDTMLLLKWERPQFRNGDLIMYEIFWVPMELNQQNNSGMNSINKTTAIDTAVVSHPIYNLEPYTEYSFQVAAYTKAGSSERSDTYPGLTDVRAPSAPVITNITYNSSNSILVEWKRPEIVYKQIDRYMIKYKAQDVSFYQEMTLISMNPSMPSPEVKLVVADISSNVVAVIIRDLHSNQKYEVSVAAATKSVFYKKYLEGPFSEPQFIKLVVDYPADSGDDLTSGAGVLAGIVCTAILLIIAIIALIYMRVYMKRNYQFISDPETSATVTNTVITLPETFANSKDDELTPPITLEPCDIDRDALTLDEFITHTGALHADSDLGFSQEYEEINRNIRTDLTADHSTDPENKHKNRYINILAYDHSRVLLKQLPGKARSDYINANFVDGYQCQRRYIAAQGPLPATFADFWRLVWEQNSVVVCMITNLTERGRRKCDQYWPSEGEATYGNITVKFMNIYKMAHYSIRVFTIKNLKVKKKYRKALRGHTVKGASERIVYQYHYTDWPDHGVPNFTLPVLMYVRKSAAASPDTAGPIVIHCSAGVGRTGTYIMLDTMMRQIVDKKTVNVYGFLSHIRNQRNYLVQTEDQYIFIHDALVGFIKSGDTEIKDTSISKYIEDLLTETDGENLLEKQYKLVTSFQPKEFHIHSTLVPVNVEKNRSQDIIPVELARVRLPAQPGEEGSDYINASFLQGYNRNDEYIVTQHPLKTTITDFWRMVWDQNSMTVLLLSETDDEEFPVFWPQKEESLECGAFKVTMTEETLELGCTTRDFILQSTQKTLQEYYECNTRIFSVSLWPDSCTPLSTAFDLVQTIKNWHMEKQEVDGPIIIIDKLGGTEASLFCGLSTLQDQLTQENGVDVYMVAKLYHLKRPGVFPKMDDFYLLYKAVDSICEDPLPAGDRDSGISNCNNYPATMPSHFTSNSLNTDTRKETTM